MSYDKEYSRAYYQKNREARCKAANDYRKQHLAERAAYMREWRKRNRDHYNAWSRANKRAHPEKTREIVRRWQESPRGRAWRAEWIVKNPDKVLAHNRRSEAVRKLRKMTDAEYYAQRRAAARVHRALTRPRKGKYRPCLSKRIPDWCVMGQVLDTRSQWLPVNLTPSQRAWLRDRAIEAKNWRER